MITINQIKEQYIDNVLTKLPYKFKIFTDTGEYQKAVRRGNTVEEYINGCLSITNTDTETLSGGEVAVAVECGLEFVVNVSDETPDGVYKELDFFRDSLSSVFEKATKISLTDNGKTYNGGVSYSLPTSGSIAIRQGIGYSFTYMCVVTIAYIENGINTSDLYLTIDNSPVAFMTISFSRSTSYAANMHKNAGSRGSSGYIESAGFQINFTAPALDGVPSSTAIFNFLFGLSNPNTPHTVTIYKNGQAISAQSMVISNCEGSGSGVSNISYNVSLVPYMTEETTGG